MRYLIWLSIWGLTLATLSAQEGGRLAFKQFPDLQATTTLMVLYDNAPAYNEALRAAVEGHWTVTPFTFIPEKDLAKYASDAKYSMLVRDNSEKSHTRVSGTTVIRRNHLALYVCGKGAKLSYYGGKDAVAQFEFADILAEGSYAVKVPALVRAMHQYLVFLGTEKITEDNHDRKLDYFRNAQASQLSGMTLYILDQDLPAALRNPARILEAYPHDFEIVSEALYKQAIAEARADVALLHLGPQAEDIYVVTPLGAPLYHAHPGLREGLEIDDFSALASRVANPPEAQLTFFEKLRQLFGGKAKSEG